MINLLLNILIYQNNDKNYDIFSRMCYDMYYRIIKFQLKNPPMHVEMKKVNYIRR